MGRPSLRDRFVDWTNKLFGTQPELLDNGELKGLDKIKYDMDQAYREYTKPKDDIEYWKTEIRKYTRYIKDEYNRLEKNMNEKNMTPAKYDRLMDGINRAIHNLEFAQQSLEKLLIVQAVTPEQTQKVRATTTRGLNKQLDNRKISINQYSQLEKKVSEYTIRNNINGIVKKLMSSKSREENELLNEQLKVEHAKLEEYYKSIGEDRYYELQNQRHELFAKNNNHRKDFLTKSEKQNEELLEQIQKDVVSTLKIKGNHSIEYIQKTIDKRIAKKQSEIADISKRLEFISKSSDTKIINMTTLGLYGELYGNSQQVADNIARKSNLSVELEAIIDKNAKTSNTGLLKRITNSFSKEEKQERLDLVFAMYPFLKDKNNEEKLTNYLKQNKTFLDRLTSSGITPEQIISEKERLDYIKCSKIDTVMDNSKKIKEMLSDKKILHKATTQQIKLSLSEKQIDNIKNLPSASKGESKESYIKRISDQMKSVSQRQVSTTSKEPISSEVEIIYHGNNNHSLEQATSSIKRKIHTSIDKIKNNSFTLKQSEQSDVEVIYDASKSINSFSSIGKAKSKISEVFDRIKSKITKDEPVIETIDDSTETMYIPTISKEISKNIIDIMEKKKRKTDSPTLSDVEVIWDRSTDKKSTPKPTSSKSKSTPHDDVEIIYDSSTDKKSTPKPTSSKPKSTPHDDVEIIYDSSTDKKSTPKPTSSKPKSTPHNDVEIIYDSSTDKKSTPKPTSSKPKSGNNNVEIIWEVDEK